MAKTFRPTWFLRALNGVLGTLLRAGLPLGVMALLTVRGRKSGQPRTTPVAVVEVNGKRYLVAAYGVVDWVRNLRAAGTGTLTRGRRTARITAVELAPREAAVILKQTSAGAPASTRPYFDTTPDSPLEAFEQEAVRHPVFEIREAMG